MTREEAQRYIAKLTYEEKKKLNDFLLASAIGAMIAPIDYAFYGEIYENFD